MHKEVLDYIEKIKKRFPDNFKDCRVLEMGSKDINGTPRHLFTNCEYIGVDQVEGDGVEIVCSAHKYNGEPFDTVITTEMLEHDECAEESLENAKRLLKDGGLLIVTAAGENRAKHYGIHRGESHYKNISKKFVLKIFPDAEVKEDSNKNDINFIWRKL